MKEHKHFNVPSFSLPAEQRSTKIFDALQGADARIQRQQELEWQVAHDRLTGLLNRQGLEEAAEKLAARMDELSFREDEGRGAPTRLAVLMFDLDGFKGINDAHGHAMGDRSLQEFANILTGMLREDDLIGRFGGDEFAAVLPIHTDDKVDADEVYEAIREKLDGALDTVRDWMREQGEDDRHIKGLGASFGVAMYDPHGSEPFDFESLKKGADMAMFANKKSRGTGR